MKENILLKIQVELDHNQWYRNFIMIKLKKKRNDSNNDIIEIDIKSNTESVIYTIDKINQTSSISSSSDCMAIFNSV